MNNTNILLILDGWGLSDKLDGNAIAQAKTPNWDYITKHYPTSLIQAHGKHVGLPDNQAGNSEVGHLHIGSGQVIPQDLVRINQALQSPESDEIKKIKHIIKQTLNANKTLHLFGLLSDGGVHSHQQHLYKILKIAQQYNCPTRIHVILDGRDTDPKSGIKYTKELNNYITKNIKVASVCGRFYAMDRDKRWQRTQAYFDAITKTNTPKEALDPISIIKNNYEKGITDEFIKPQVTNNFLSISENDTILCFNYRADRSQQIIQALSGNKFNEFNTRKYFNSNTYTLTPYPLAPKNAKSIFSKIQTNNTLGDIIEANNLSQLRIAETEKYAHVTFFLDGGEIKARKNMQTITVPSPRVSTYDLEPKMSCAQITEHIIESIGKFDVIVANFANADMVGHTGFIGPCIEAVEHIDLCLGKIIKALEGSQHNLLITADHGNAEAMGTPERPITSHSSNPVPLVYVGKRKLQLKDGGLSNIAPTLLTLMGIKPASKMNESLLF